ncbi:MAG: ATP-binding protein [Sphingobacteriia bacterium]|nr:MAG: ATP-binding protein [Sphingobacteriia bacterium]TAG30345.1 MAG: ATP-binding protein [Sphingobacteriia bacterium]
MKKTNTLSSARIRQQLKYDLIGKDSYRGITLSYAYLANQTGHFALAFAPAAGLFIILKNYTALADPGLWSGLISTLLWVGFELYNITVQLKEARQANQSYIFKPDYKNIIADTLIDMGYFAFGGLTFVAGSTALYNDWFFILPIVLLFFLLYISRSWYITKICQQTAYYPYQLRLSQWKHAISESDKKIVGQYFSAEKKGQHIFLFGPQQSGKTGLAVALTNEFSIQRKKCLYLTGTKLLAQLYDTDAAIFAEDEFALCTWRTADYLVIDDINPGDPIWDETITAGLFLNHLNARPENALALWDKNIIWVLGNINKTDLKKDWIQLLESINIQQENIHTIQLGIAIRVK